MPCILLAVCADIGSIYIHFGEPLCLALEYIRCKVRGDHLSARSFQKRFRETFGYLRTFGFITPFKVSGRKISVQFGFIMISFCVKTRLNG